MISYQNEDLKVMDELPVYVVKLDLDLKVAWANRQAVEFHEDILGRKCYTGFNPDMEQCTFCPIVRAINSKSTEISLVEVTSMDGNDEKVYEVTAIPIFDEMQVMTGIYEVRRDVTLQLAMKVEKAEVKSQSKKSKEEAFASDHLLDIVSNELREHLDMAFRMHANFNIRKLTHEQKMNLAGIRTALMKSQNVLNNITTMQNINKGNIKQSKKKTNLKDIVVDKFSNYQNKAMFNGNTLDYKFDSTIPSRLIMDRRKMELIMSNLIEYCLTNTANRFLNMTISMTEETPDQVKVSFQMKNVGSIAINDLVQKDQTGFVRNNLSLSVLQHLTESLDGTMTMVPTSGYGIDLEVVIGFKKPFAAAKLPFFTRIKEEFKNTERIQTSEEKARKKILIAEDEPIGRITIEQMLKNDYDVILAKNGKVAVEKYFEEDPDLVIMDIMMPIMNGFDAFDQIERNCINRVPIIACTAKVINSEREYLKSYGFDDYIAKPVSVKSLRTLIKQHLG